jgi:hypothetical protein
LERLTGLPRSRETPWEEPWWIYVFNPSPYPRSDIVRLPLDPHPWFGFQGEDRSFALHPWLVGQLGSGGFTVDGVPARIVAEPEAPRIRLQLDQAPRAIEFIARDVPPFACVRMRLQTRSDVPPEATDTGREIGNEFFSVEAQDTGTFHLEFRASGRRFTDLGDWEDMGDRGDTYDFDPVPGSGVVEDVTFSRTIHPSGIQTLRISRTLRLPARLALSRYSRSEETVLVPLTLELCAAQGVPRLTVTARVDNRAHDHRLRLLFPTGTPTQAFAAATTLDIVTRSTHVEAHPNWVHPPPCTFPHQGFVSANGLTVTAPGLPEAEVTPDGTIAITLLRAVGWLSLPGLKTRPELAGPTIPTPGAQCLGPLSARLALSEGVDAHSAEELAASMWAIPGGNDPILSPGRSLLAIEPRDVLLSALLPAPRGRALWLRLLNPWSREIEACVRIGFPVVKARSIRLDGKPTKDTFQWSGNTLRCTMRAHQLRSFSLVLPE